MNTPLIVTARRVIVAPGEPVVDHGAVLLADGAILAIGSPAELLQRSPGAELLHFPGATVLPGLINAHVHLAFDASSAPVAVVRSGHREALRDMVASHARQLLDGGVTTIRDLGDRDGIVAELRDAIATGSTVGPRILSSFAPLTSLGGHCFFLGGEVGDDASIRSVIANHAARGADVIKVMASGGRLTPTGAQMFESQFTQRQLNLVVSMARNVGLLIAAHAHGTESMRMCARAGVDTIEHGGWLVGPTAVPRCYSLSHEIAEQIAAAGIYICPARSRNWPTFDRLDELLERLAWMDGHGIRLVSGTDAGVAGSVFDDVTAGALGLYQAAGWSLPRVLAMATTDAAEALGLGDRIGRVKAGYSADLLVVSGDPLTDLQALRNVRCVVAAGLPYYPRAAGPTIN